MKRQIPLDLVVEPDHSFDNFVETDTNTHALNALKTWESWPAPVFLVLGPKGSGKTHLGQAWAQALSANIITTAELPSETIKYGFIDDADQFSPSTLFDLINSALAGEMRALLLTSTLQPTDWPHEIPDLYSRLKNTANVTLQEANDDLIDAIIRKLFEDAGRLVKKDLVDYLSMRCERDVPSLRQTVLYLDSQARADKADMTKTYASRILNRQKDLF